MDILEDLRTTDRSSNPAFFQKAADEIERLRAIVSRVEAVIADFEGMTGSGYQYMAAHVRDAIKVPNA